MRSNNATAVASPKPRISGRVVFFFRFRFVPECLHSLRIRWGRFWLLAQKKKKISWKVNITNQHVHVKLICCTNVAVITIMPQAYNPRTFQKRQLPWLPCFLGEVLTKKNKSWMDLRFIVQNPTMIHPVYRTPTDLIVFRCNSSLLILHRFFSSQKKSSTGLCAFSSRRASSAFPSMKSNKSSMLRVSALWPNRLGLATSLRNFVCYLNDICWHVC